MAGKGKIALLLQSIRSADQIVDDLMHPGAKGWNPGNIQLS